MILEMTITNITRRPHYLFIKYLIYITLKLILYVEIKIIIIFTYSLKNQRIK